MNVFIYIFSQFIITIFFLFLLEKFSYRFNVVDFASIEERKIHREHIPILGGVGIFLGIFFGMILSGNFDKVLGVIISGALLVVIGLIDDSFNLKPKIKLFFQIISAILLLYSTDFIPQITGNVYINWIFGILFVITVINASNMNDGFDGQLSMLGLIFITVLFVILKFPFFTYLFIPLLVFLFFNLPRARMFLGDAGSMLIGVIIAYSGLLLFSSEGFWKGLLIFCLAFYIPLFDLIFAIYRRISDKHNLFQADKGHLHHIFLAQFKSTGKVLFYYSSIAIIIGILAIVLSFLEIQVLFIIFDLIILIITGIILYLISKKGIFRQGEK